MLPKKNRVNKKEVKLLFKQSSTIIGDILFLKFDFVKKTFPKISFIVPKKIAKLATERNQLKRKGYSALASLLKNNPLPIKGKGVFVFKANVKNKQKLENDIKKILDKTH